MKKLCHFLVLFLVLGCIAWFIVSVLIGMEDPDSFWCVRKIYQQPNGTYEVWWNARTRHLEATFNTYREAKEYQVKKCRELAEFMTQSPKGKRVR